MAANTRKVIPPIEEGITGTVKYHKKLKSQFLDRSRDVVVWLPPGYDKAAGERYPVLYVHDGQNIFDPATAFGGVDWQLDETADRLIQEKKMQKVLMVGIYNTRDRLLEYADTPRGRGYMKFLVDELKPFIDKSYRTRPDRQNTAVMGSSMGGLITLYLLWRHPDIFAKGASLSPSLFWKRCSVLKMIREEAASKKEMLLYFDHSGEGGEGDHASDYRYLRRLLQSQGYEPGIDFEYYFDRKGDHSEHSWARRVWRPLTFLFGIK